MQFTMCVFVLQQPGSVERVSEGVFHCLHLNQAQQTEGEAVALSVEIYWLKETYLKAQLFGNRYLEKKPFTLGP
ncbi:hypothetical protein E2C01_042013 [Portunus trituberculatus]|uniref:Uncharacterized protein n=1 Tax=Portunus trituberculatus TaxID=210409 RepID=A0A5B7FS81_PORTR|nr:hypothetical protein [Portunus trituberculatus]